MKILSIIFNVLFLTVCNASYINKINIVGNSHTKNNIITREILHPLPAKLDSNLLKEDRDRIYNLGLFSTVEIYSSDSTYNIFVVETFRFLPLPLIEYDEGQGLSLGAGISFLNFKGLNQKLLFGVIGGKQETVFLSFYDPWAYGNHGSISSEILRYYQNSFNYNYYYRETAFKLGTGFYSGKNIKYKIRLGFEDILIDTINDNSKSIINLKNIDKQRFNYFTGFFKYENDTRDIYSDPTQGGRFQIEISPKINIKTNQHRFNIDMSFKKFYSLNKLPFEPVFSFKTQLVIKYTRALPIFDREYIGGEGFIRGYSPIIKKNHVQIQNHIEGSQIIYNSAQFQHTLLEKHDYNGIEFGVDIVYFVDYGLCSQSLYKLKSFNSLIGYGIGFRYFISGAGVISLDFGFNPYGQLFIHPSDGNY
jgi:outer membrane protein insertion porin family